MASSRRTIASSSRALLVFFVSLLAAQSYQALERFVGDHACPCNSTAAAAGYLLHSNVRLLPELGSLDCKADPQAQCVPANNMEPGVDGCFIGKLEVAMPIDWKPPNWTAVHSDDWERAMDMIMTYREHLCSPSHYYAQQLEVNCDEDFLKLEHTQELKVQGVVLDYGADPSGQQLQILARHVVGSLVGYNTKEPGWSPLQRAFRHPSNYSLVFGDEGSCLPFPNATFDFVYSINVLEHAQHWQQYLSEAMRVLKPGGMFYTEMHPLWWSARGHHVNIDMVHSWARVLEPRGFPECKDTELAYANDGTFIPDFAHLFMSREELAAHLKTTKLQQCPKIIDIIADFVYGNHESLSLGVNRVRIADVRGFLEDHAMQLAKQRYWSSVKGIDYVLVERLAAKYGHSDFLLSGAALTYVKPSNTGQA